MARVATIICRKPSSRATRSLVEVFFEFVELKVAAHDLQVCAPDSPQDFRGLHVRDRGEAHVHEAGRRTEFNNAVPQRGKGAESAVEILHQLLSYGENLASGRQPERTRLKFPSWRKDVPGRGDAGGACNKLSP